MFDKGGVLSSERTDLSSLQQKYSKGRVGITFGRGFKRADVFFRFVSGEYFNPEMLWTNDPIVFFAMANPDPEIEYNLAISTKAI
jgi:malate dehydrogenase (oxaloacetate-decarboxylating)(NADP+)